MPFTEFPALLPLMCNAISANDYSCQLWCICSPLFWPWFACTFLLQHFCLRSNYIQTFRFDIRYGDSPCLVLFQNNIANCFPIHMNFQMKTVPRKKFRRFNSLIWNSWHFSVTILFSFVRKICNSSFLGSCVFG